MNTPRTRELRRRTNLFRRRSVRQALAVIPANSTSGEFASLEVRTMDNLMNSHHGNDPWNSAPSPDELVIQKRGRRSRTIVWSPNPDDCKRDNLLSLSSRDRTPIKSPSKSDAVLRSTPRKRLSLFDARQSEFTTPERKEKPLHDLKSLGANTLQNQSDNNLVNGLRGLSHEQLIELIMDLVATQEDGLLCESEKLRNVIFKKMPIADIQPLIDKLGILRQNVYASLVSSNLDDSAYSRAYIHLDAFQKALMEQGKKLQDSHHWISLMRYVLSAWGIIRELPEWKSQGIHSTTRKCFKSLSQFCMEAITKGNFETSILKTCSESLRNMVGDCEDIQICLQLIKSKI